MENSRWLGSCVARGIPFHPSVHVTTPSCSTLSSPVGFVSLFPISMRRFNVFGGPIPNVDEGQRRRFPVSGQSGEFYDEVLSAVQSLFPSSSVPTARCRGISYKAVVNAKHSKREESIMEAVALTTRELTQEEHHIVSSSSTFHLRFFQSNLMLQQRVRLFK